MGLFDGLLGGVVGAGMASVVGHLIEEHGGVGAMVSELQAKGLGPAVSSWVSTGPNQAVTGDAIHAALGSKMVGDLAAKFGMTPDEVAAKLAQVLPGAVDHLTPGGVVPPA